MSILIPLLKFLRKIRRHYLQVRTGKGVRTKLNGCGKSGGGGRIFDFFVNIINQ